MPNSGRLGPTILPRTLALALALGAVLLSDRTSAAAGLPLGEPATQGLYNPSVAISGDADASAIDKNPASLGMLRSWSLSVLGHAAIDDGYPIRASGAGLFFATPLPVVRALSLGLGAQLILPPRGFAYPDLAKISVSLAWRLSPMVSIGLSYHHLAAERAPISAGVDTLDLALALRLHRYLAAGLVVRDVPGPSIGGAPLQRSYEAELAIRPGTERLELGIGSRFGERRRDIDPRFRLWATPARGVHLKLEVEWRRDYDLDRRMDNDVRAALGLQLDLDRVGLAWFAQFGRNGGSSAFHGYGVMLRVSGERYPSSLGQPVHIEKIDLGQNLARRGLVRTLAHLRRLERNARTVGVAVVIGKLPGRWALAEEVRAALLRLRAAGKRVYACFAGLDTRGYYVASAADKLYVDPAGGIDLLGLSATTLYFRGTGDLLGVKADFVRIGDWKSAPERYTRTAPSSAAAEQRDALLDDTYRHLVEAVAASRRVGSDAVRAWIGHGAHSPPEALKAGLVDEVHRGEEIEAAINADLGVPVRVREPPSSPERPVAWMAPRIAVLHIEGEISDGKSRHVPILDLRYAGAETILPAIRAAADDPRIRGIVVRIDSPGGSALASDRIAHELERARRAKPVVCSLGDLAASGGYYIASSCERIFTAPSTITGSIGIFTGKFDVTGLAAKLGITVDRAVRGSHADQESLFRPYTDEERTAILAQLRYYYGLFLDTVARGRRLDRDKVDAIGQGRVWSGEAAIVRKLADELGGVMDAVAWARARAGIRPGDDVELLSMPADVTLLGQLLDLLGISWRPRSASATESAVSQLLALTPGLVETLRALPASLLEAPSTPLARMPESITIR